MDYSAAQKLVTRYRSRLTRLQNQQNHQGIVALWKEMESEFERLGYPLPDQWRNWERAAEDALYTLQRESSTW
jgi:hypothetical protein